MPWLTILNIVLTSHPWLLPALTPQQPDARQELDEIDFGVSSAMR